ncbi:hypothetical protein [Paenibacillus ehimensis]|uniref:hypothetical protein n=1 Tax=Paenibacillus ehimensis TaxID=79264 RepID=UPI00046F78C1|nr:hypothetical protein [Paenibacillus ehimensis]
MTKWNVDNWLTFSSVIVAFLGVILTGIFSFLLWRATIRSTRAAESSAEAARAATRLAESAERERKEKASAIRAQLILDILNKADVMRKFIVSHQRGETNVETMKSIPRTHSIPAFHLAEYFTNEERQFINDAWESYDKYIKDFWTNTNFEIGYWNHSKDENQRNAVLFKLQEKFLFILNNLR